MAKRCCILVLGVHRSGTSALTRVINLLGAALPKNLMPPTPNNNEVGFWEPQNLWLLHDQMLREAGSRWNDWRKLDLGILPPERIVFYKSEIRRLIAEEFNDAPLFVLKDPRICRFVPLYQGILGDMGIDVKYILIHRHPRAVEASLKVRNKMPEACSQLLWLRYVLEAEKTTRNWTRKFLSYEALLTDTERQVEELIDALALTKVESSRATMAEIKSSLRQDLQHQKAVGNVAPTFPWLEVSWLVLEEAMNTGDLRVAALQSIERAFAKAEGIAVSKDYTEASALALMLAGEQAEIGVPGN
jgi:hypothetical protein